VVGIPGGFSFGDYLRCGAIAARAPIARAVIDHAGRGGYVLGICNGFQVLTETGLLPGTLMRNAGLRFVCRPVGCGWRPPTAPSPPAGPRATG
jgi:phosphoribosylformylglycinamidine synthase subunit PurQ / glutaminase